MMPAARALALVLPAALGFIGCGERAAEIGDVTPELTSLWDRIGPVIAPNVIRLANGTCLDGNRLEDGWTLKPGEKLDPMTTPDQLGLSRTVAPDAHPLLRELVEQPSFSLAGWSRDLEKYGTAFVIAPPDRLDELIETQLFPVVRVSPPIPQFEESGLEFYELAGTDDWWMLSPDRRTQCHTTAGTITGLRYIQCQYVSEALGAQARFQLPVSSRDDVPEMLGWTTHLIGRLHSNCPPGADPAKKA